MERLSLIGVSSEDDLLNGVATAAAAAAVKILPDRPGSGPSGKYKQHNCAGLETVHECPVKMSKQVEIPELSVSPEKKPAKFGKLNLRKSLAWDNAFFTSEGVLNAEELATVNSTFKKTDACALSAIQEDTVNLDESTSILDSDSWAMENFEVDLFEKVRASIQKSYASKELDLSHQNMMKPHNVLERHGLFKEREVTSKEAFDHSRVNSSSTGNLKLLLKPPRIAPRNAPLPNMPTKKSSASDAIQTETNSGKPPPGNSVKRLSVTNLKRSGVPRTSNSRDMPSPKSISGAHLGYEARLVSSSSDSSGISPEENSRKRSSRHIGRPSSRSNPQTITRASNSKILSRKADNPPTCLKPIFKLSSSESPNSSINSAVSASSTSLESFPLKHINSTESLGASSSSSSSRSSVQPSDFSKLSTDQRCPRIGSSGILSQGQLTTRGISRNLISSSGAKGFKPSGLRMPIPKVGYFDVEKPLICSSNKFSQTGLRNNLSKNPTAISSPVRNKLETAKLQSGRPVQNTAHGTKTALSPTLRRLSKSAEQHSTKMVTKSRNLCSKVKMNLSPTTSEDGCTRVFEVPAVVSEMTEYWQSGLRLEEQASQLNTKPKADIIVGEKRVSSGERNCDLSCCYPQQNPQSAETEPRD